MSQPPKKPEPLPAEVGGFPVEGLLGTGGMGRVFKVRDPDFERELALKMSLHAGGSDDPALIRFIGEGRLIGQLQHPAITPIYHLAQDGNGRWFYTMKRVRGKTLSALLREVERGEPEARAEWSLRRLLNTFVSICQALAYAHSRGVIHRDLKPDNIMLGEYGELYVMDWGLAKTVTPAGTGSDRDSAGAGQKQPGATGHQAAKAAPAEPTAAAELQVQFSKGFPSEVAEETTNMKSPHVATDGDTAEGRGGGNDSRAQGQKSTSATPEPVGTSRGQRGSALHSSTNARWGESDDPEAPIRRYAPSAPLTADSGRIFQDDLTLNGAIIGTIGYMAPEQARGEGTRQDARTDLYAMGAILWLILTGQPFRTTTNRTQALLAAAGGERPDFETVARHRRIEPELRDACFKALEPEPENRFATAREFGQAIQAWLNGERAWKQVYASDFTVLPDQDTPPAGWQTMLGHWGIRSGTLCPLISSDAVIHLAFPAEGDVRMVIEGWIEPGSRGELAAILAAPVVPRRKQCSDGYCIEFGANDMQLSKFARDEQDVAFAPGAAPEPGRSYRLVAENLGGTLRLEVDGREVLRQRDFFPLRGPRVGLYAYGTAPRYRRIELWTAGVAKQQSCLSVPDTLGSFGHWTEALGEYERIIESHPGSAEADEAAFKAGLCLLESGQADAARRRFEQLASTPLAALGCVGLSALLQQEGQPPAVEAAALVRGLEEATDPGAEGLADLYLRTQIRAAEFDRTGVAEAVGLWEALAARALVPGEIRGQFRLRLAQSLWRANRGGEALALLLQIPQEHRTHPDLCAQALVEASQAAFSLYRFEEGLALSRRVLAEFSGLEFRCMLARWNVLRSLNAQGRFQEVLDAEPLRAAPALEPSFNIEREQMLAYWGLGNGARAAAWAAQSAAQEGFSNTIRADALTYLASVQIDGGQVELARATYRQIISQYPQERLRVVRAQAGLAGLVCGEGGFAEAEASLLKTIAAFPDQPLESARMLLTMAGRYQQRGDYAGATRCLNRIGTLPNLTLEQKGDWIIQLALLQAAQGDRAGAYRYLKEAAAGLQRIPAAPRAAIWLGLWAGAAGDSKAADGHWSGLPVSGEYWSLPVMGYYWIAECFRGGPGGWRVDERGVALTPAETMRRIGYEFRGEFSAMLEFRAGYDSAWRGLADSGPAKTQHP